MAPISSQQVCTLLADSLVVWKIAGDVGPAPPPAAAVIHAADGTMVSVEAAAISAHPIRWWVRWHAPGTEPRCRPCVSVIGLLRTVRAALGNDGGNRLRIAPAPNGG